MDQVRHPEFHDDVLHRQRPLALHYGGTIAHPRLAWRLAGRAEAPVVVALGGISAHRRVFDTQEPRAGWWCEVAGPGRALDSERLRILGIDYLGGSGDSSAPQPGEAFPSLSSYDQAEVLRDLLDHLRIERLRGFVGASYGGMVALAFAERYPERVEQLVVISAADRTHPLSTAWRSVQRHIVRFALAQNQATEGLQLARALAMATYRSPEEFAARFAQPPRRVEERFVFPIEDYLFARGRDYASRYRAEAFMCLSESIDLHAVEASRIGVPTTLVAVREDQLVPLADMRALAFKLPQARLQELSSLHGHDAFLKEAGALQSIFQPLYGEG
ncbi:MAG TPA: homoserine O-succinyltransferase [Steroidobacteraceae bacterium]|nr:homoserine O-succinyltransferase [Steroidobacteraceae bacterium]